MTAATKVTIACGLGFAALLVLASMWVFGWGAFTRATADFRGETGQIERTRADADYRIANYDHFFDLCASVQSKEATIDSLEQELETDPREQRAEQIQATLTAVRASRAEAINQYNADAAKEATAAQFRASNLPPKLSIDEGETECASS